MMDFSQMTPEQLERIKEMMRSRGMTEEQIEERIERMRKRAEEAKQAESSSGGDHQPHRPADRP